MPAEPGSTDARDAEASTDDQWSQAGSVATFEDLQRELPLRSRDGLRFRVLRAASRTGALVSEGLRIGHERGFDSGPFMAHVYADTPRGRRRCAPPSRTVATETSRWPTWRRGRRRTSWMP